jgi:hypothetical protein
MTYKNYKIDPNSKIKIIVDSYSKELNYNESDWFFEEIQINENLQFFLKQFF